MGIRAKGVRYIEEIFSELSLKDFKGLRLLQIGDLSLRMSAYAIVGTAYHKSSGWFKNMGFEVVTIDLEIGCGKVDAETLRYNLSEPIMEDIGQFDFIIDFGAGEHVNNQYWLHRNIHDLCKISGVILHCNPSSPKYGKEGHHHGLFFYTVPFYENLSELCGYKIIDIRETSPDYWIKRNYCIFVSLHKDKNASFPSLKDFNTYIATGLGVIETVKKGK